MHADTGITLRALIFASIVMWMPPAQAGQGLEWREFNSAVFDRAQVENKLVILDLEAVWCHWCHVMHQTTYTDPEVLEYLSEHYVATRADQDARPDLAQRYRDYGWPATIIFTADGMELVKRAGYIAPGPMRRLLEAVVKDPSPEPAALTGTSVSGPGQTQLPQQLREALIARHQASEDKLRGGLRLNQKFLDADSVEYSLSIVRQGGDQAFVEARRARRTLDAAAELIDPVWGGVYQYSTRASWQNPHYEKIVTTQARYLRLYAVAAVLLNEPRYLDNAERVASYLYRFLQDDNGAFYTSQDADLNPGQKAHDYYALDNEARLKQGMPRIDKNIYARENGWLIEGLVDLYAYGGDQRHLIQARRAAEEIAKTRLTDSGGYKHGENDQHAGYLGDNLAMLGAWLALHAVTGDRQDLAKAQQVAGFIADNFNNDPAGFISAQQAVSPLAPVVDIDENIRAARFFNRLYHYSGDARWKKQAKLAMRFLSQKTIALSRLTDAGILLADQALSTPPLHLAVVGPKQAPLAVQLFRQAIKLPTAYKRTEWWDHSEGRLANPDVPYPEFDQAAGYVCSEKRCSSPAFSVPEYQRSIKRLTAAH